jgi:hypothetical protein
MHFFFESSVSEAMTFSRVSRLFQNPIASARGRIALKDMPTHLLLMNAPSLRLSVWLVACSLPAKSIKLNRLILTAPFDPGERRGPLGVFGRSEGGGDAGDKGSSRDSIVCGAQSQRGAKV